MCTKVSYSPCDSYLLSPISYLLSTMKQVIVLKLEPTAAQQQSLLTTMQAFNQGCQYVGELAFAHRLANKIALQPMVYHELRERFGLSSQMAVRAISSACEAYKTDRDAAPQFDSHAPMILDARLLSIKGLTDVSLLCLTGRQLIPFRFVRYASARPDRIAGQADLEAVEGAFYLYVHIELPSAPPLNDTDSP